MTTLWRDRGFVHLWGAQATSAFGTRIGREAIALSAVMLLGSGPLDLAWLNLAASLPYLIFGLAAGVLIDRVRRRPLLIATDLIRAGLLATIPVAAWFGGFSLGQLLVVVFLGMACTLVFDAAHQAYVPSLIEKRWLLDANAKQESTSAASEVVGPPIGGLLVQILGAPVAILCDAVALRCGPVCRALREVVEDGVGFGEMEAVRQADGRHLAIRVPGQEFGRAGGAVIDVELDALEFEAELAQQQAHLVGVAGAGGVVEHELGLAGHGTPSDGLRVSPTDPIVGATQKL